MKREPNPKKDASSAFVRELCEVLQVPPDVSSEKLREALRALAARRAERRRLPEERASKVRKFELPPIPRDPRVCQSCGHLEEVASGPPLKLYVIPGFFADGTLGEIFIRADKVGSFASGILDGLAIVISLALQHGVSRREIADKFVGQQFAPAGLTGDPKYPIVTSVLDYLGRWLREVEAPK